MFEQDRMARIRATIEEELGTFRQFADLPATDIEAIAARLTRSVASFLSEDRDTVRESRAA